MNTRIGIVFTEGNYRDAADFSHIRQWGYEPFTITKAEQVAEADALILPGGDSTRILKAIGGDYGLGYAVREAAEQGKPTWGLCAGMVVLSDRAVVAKGMEERVKEAGYDPTELYPLQVLHCVVERFAWGLGSFTSTIYTGHWPGYTCRFSDAPRPVWNPRTRGMCSTRTGCVMIRNNKNMVIGTSWWTCVPELEKQILAWWLDPTNT